MRLGNIAQGDEFFARTTELSDFWRYLEDNHVVLTGPRRLGKSSLLTRLAEQAAKQGVLAHLLDVEGLDSAQAFVRAMEHTYPDTSVTAFAKAASAKATGWMRRVKKVGADLPAGLGGASLELEPTQAPTWYEQALRLQKRLSNAPVLVLVDEFSVFLEKALARDANEAELFLGWLRTWRQSDGASRWVFSGSVGINALLERHKLGTRLNDCYEFALGPFRPDEARAMLVEQAHREGWLLSPALADHMCARIAWRSPFYLNLLLDETCKAGRDRLQETHTAVPPENTLQTADVDDAYDRLLATRSRFHHWHQRLARDLPQPHLDFSLTVLSCAAKADQGLSRSQMLARLVRQEKDPLRRGERLSNALLYLEEQGYLSQRQGSIQFTSFLLRDYWKRNHAH